MLNITTTAGRIAAAYVTVGRKDVRYFLNQPLFERAAGKDDLTIVSTDGHRMVVQEKAGKCAGLGADQTIIEFDAETVKELSKACNREVDVIIECGVGSSDATVTYLGKTAPAKVIDGKYPDWRRIVPKEGDGASSDAVNFDASYLADYHKVEKLLCGKPSKIPSMIKFWPGGAIRPMLVTFPRIEGVRGVIMPVRE